MTSSQTSRIPLIKSRFEAWKHLPFIVSVSLFGEPYSNGDQPIRVAWQYGEAGNFRLDGSALIVIGTRGAMRIIHATDGIGGDDVKTAGYVSVMVGIKTKLV